MADAAPAPVKQRQGAEGRARRVVTFGADMPSGRATTVSAVENGMAWLVRALEADETRSAAGRREDERSSSSA